jgi:hypothetical protein
VCVCASCFVSVCVYVFVRVCFFCVVLVSLTARLLSSDLLGVLQVKAGFPPTPSPSPDSVVKTETKIESAPSDGYLQSGNRMDRLRALLQQRRREEQDRLAAIRSRKAPALASSAETQMSASTATTPAASPTGTGGTSTPLAHGAPTTPCVTCPVPATPLDRIRNGPVPATPPDHAQNDTTSAMIKAGRRAYVLAEHRQQEAEQNSALDALRLLEGETAIPTLSSGTEAVPPPTPTPTTRGTPSPDSQYVPADLPDPLFTPLDRIQCNV